MGEDFDFFSPLGGENPKILRKLRDIPGLENPELLTRFLDGHAGSVFDFGLFGVDDRVRAVRKKLKPLFLRMKKLAAEIKQVEGSHDDVDIFGSAIASLMESDNVGQRDTSARRLESAINIIAAMPLREDISSGGRPNNDEAVQRVVDAIAMCFREQGLKFSGASRLANVDRKQQHIVKSEEARLTTAVLLALGVKLQAKTIATHMRRANVGQP